MTSGLFSVDVDRFYLSSRPEQSHTTLLCPGAIRDPGGHNVARTKTNGASSHEARSAVPGHVCTRDPPDGDRTISNRVQLVNTPLRNWNENYH